MATQVIPKQENNQWKIRYWANARGPDGVQRRVRRTKCLGPAKNMSFRDAEREAILFLSRPEHAEKVEPKTMNDLIEQWRVAVKPTLKRSSQMSYEWAFGRLVPTFGERFIGDITKVEVQRFLTATSRNLSGKSVTNLRGWLRALLSVAVEDWITTNPAAGRLRLPEMVPIRRKIVLEPAQFHKLRDGLKSPYDCIVSLAVLSGLRKGEIASLRWEDIGPGSITVDEAVYAGTLSTPKTRKSRREVRIGKAVRSALENWHKKSKFKGARDFVFAIRVNSPIDLHNATARHILPACKKLKLPNIGWHDLRHTYTTWGRRAGVPVEAMRDQLGHASAMLTLDVYSHAGDDPKKAAAAIERYAKVLWKTDPGAPNRYP